MERKDETSPEKTSQSPDRVKGNECEQKAEEEQTHREVVLLARNQE